MTNDRPLPETEDTRFWPQLIAWQTAEVNDAMRRGSTDDAATWQRLRADAVRCWADQETGTATLNGPLKATRLPDGSAGRGRKGH